MRLIGLTDTQISWIVDRVQEALDDPKIAQDDIDMLQRMKYTLAFGGSGDQRMYDR